MQYRSFLRNHYHELTKTLVSLGDHAETARRVEEMISADLPEGKDEPGMVAYIGAFHLVALRGPGEAGQGLSPAQREAAVEKYGMRVDALCEEAARRGANQPEILHPVADLLLSLPAPPRPGSTCMALNLARRCVEARPGGLSEALADPRPGGIPQSEDGRGSPVHPEGRCDPRSDGTLGSARPDHGDARRGETVSAGLCRWPAGELRRSRLGDLAELQGGHGTPTARGILPRSAVPPVSRKETTTKK